MAKKKVIKSEKFLSPEMFSGDKNLALDFALKVQKKFDQIVKAIVLFGSEAKNSATPRSDIDVVIIIDDASVEWDLELVSWYREELGKILSTMDGKKSIHANTIKLTTWWQDLLHGDPVVLNILRYGEPLIDVGGFFNPLKALLLKGKISPTPEAVYVALQRAPTHLARSKLAEAGAIEGIYWTMVDSAQAALIMAGKTPPSPEHISAFLKNAFVDRNMLKPVYAKAFTEIYELHKGIAHGTVREIRGVDIDKWQEIAQKFLNEMTRIIDSLIPETK